MVRYVALDSCPPHSAHKNREIYAAPTCSLIPATHLCPNWSPLAPLFLAKHAPQRSKATGEALAGSAVEELMPPPSKSTSRRNHMIRACQPLSLSAPPAAFRSCNSRDHARESTSQIKSSVVSAPSAASAHFASASLTRLKAASPASQSSLLKEAETITRTRALPLATMGKMMGEAKTPSSKSFALKALA